VRYSALLYRAIPAPRSVPHDACGNEHDEIGTEQRPLRAWRQNLQLIASRKFVAKALRRQAAA
jgi:hypothetical protein